MDESTLIIGGVALTLVLIIAVVFFLLRKRISGKPCDTVLLLGLSDSGKTQLISRLVTGQAIQTYTSLQENIVPSTTFGRRTVRLIDVPGSDRIRKPRMKHYLSGPGQSEVLACIIVVDSAAISKQARDVAELVYDTLAGGVPTLIACNKQDMPLAKSTTLVRTLLGKELALLDQSRQAQSRMQGADIEVLRCDVQNNTLLWDSLPVDVEFSGCAASSASAAAAAGEDDDDSGAVGDVRDWIAAL